MKTIKAKLEFEDPDIPKPVMRQVILQVLKNEGMVSDEDEVPHNIAVTLDKRGQQADGSYLVWVTLQVPEPDDEIERFTKLVDVIDLGDEPQKL